METAKRQAQLLHIYVLELKTCLKRIDDLHMLQRNPYLRTRAAKQALNDVCDSMQHCLDAVLVFMASVSRLQLCDAAAIRGYHGACQILFDFQDDIMRQEILHQLLLKEKTVRQRLEQFMTVSEHLLQLVMAQNEARENPQS